MANYWSVSDSVHRLQKFLTSQLLRESLTSQDHDIIPKSQQENSSVGVRRRCTIHTHRETQACSWVIYLWLWLHAAHLQQILNTPLYERRRRNHLVSDSDTHLRNYLMSVRYKYLSFELWFLTTTSSTDFSVGIFSVNPSFVYPYSYKLPCKSSKLESKTARKVPQKIKSTKRAYFLPVSLKSHLHGHTNK